MAEKQRYTVTVPDHVATAVETHATQVSATPTEYATDILRWWFGKGCPPLTEEEEVLREVSEESGDKLRLKSKPDVDAYFRAKKKEHEVWLEETRKTLKAQGYEETPDGKWFKPEARTPAKKNS